MCVPDAGKGQKGAYDLLQVELWMLASHRVGAGRQIWILSKSNKYSWLLSYFSSLIIFFFLEGGGYFGLFDSYELDLKCSL